MDTIYDLFSKYYRELIYCSGHFEKERKVIVQIAERFLSGYHSKILDAACGTGDALSALHEEGYINLSGLDGSLKMIERAKEIVPQCHFYHMKWEELPEISQQKAQYHLIFLISMSLPHAHRENIPTILSSFYEMLRPGGTLVFDNRMWVTDKNNCLIEENRPVGIFHNPREIQFDNQLIIIEDKCEYVEDRQKITYRIREKHFLKSDLLLSVDYVKMLTEEYLQLLSDAGFHSCNSYLSTGWLYEIIYANK